MAEMTDVANAMFKYRRKWVSITVEDKEKFFFIFNRFLSKIYPEKAQLLNLKNINKAAAFDTWFYFMKDEPYPDCFWSKSEKSEKSDIKEADYESLLKHLSIKDVDLDYLIENCAEFIKEELNYLKKIEKGN